MPVSDFQRAYQMFKPHKAVVIESQVGAVRVRLMSDGSEPLRWYPSLEQDTPVGDAGVLLQVNSEEYAFIPDNLPLAKTPNIYELRQRMDKVIDEDIPNAVGPAVEAILPDEVAQQLSESPQLAPLNELGELGQVLTVIGTEADWQDPPPSGAVVSPTPPTPTSPGMLWLDSSEE